MGRWVYGGGFRLGVLISLEYRSVVRRGIGGEEYGFL